MGVWPEMAYLYSCRRERHPPLRAIAEHDKIPPKNGRRMLRVSPCNIRRFAFQNGGYFSQRTLIGTARIFGSFNFMTSEPS